MNITLIVIVYIAAVILLLHPWSRGFYRNKVRKHAPVNHFSAISLACDSDSCPEMAMMGGRRFLVDDAPELPLQQCTEGTCGSRYVHHDDRRSDIDRRLVSRRAEENEGMDRRSLRGRRKSDWSLLAVSG